MKIERTKKSFFNLARNRLIKRNIFTSRCSKEDIGGLISLIRPVRSGRTLVRIGPKGDGGYVVPDDFEGVTACFSPGVSTNSSFENSMAERGIRSYLADASVDGPVGDNPLFNFQKSYVSDVCRGDYIRFSDWVDEKSSDDDDLVLQMDIEGDEYRCLIDCDSNILRRFRIMLIEFHNLEATTTKIGFAAAHATFKRLQSLFTSVHVHPNNIQGIYDVNGLKMPSVLEITFLRNDRFLERSPYDLANLNLDFLNNPNYPSFKLPEYYYQQ